ncbi:MAG: hypothetical protein JWN61_3115 [Pseudonocardiales bacterium]|nr:hypothetical protein [Pseudonocardiales bacterium]
MLPRMPNEINGIPAHALVVHAVVILVPLAAVLSIVSCLWPAARRRLGILVPLSALVGLIFVPLATSAGEWLEKHVQETDLVRRHTELGDSLTVWAILLFALSALLWLLDTAGRRSWGLPPFLRSVWARRIGGLLLMAVAAVSIIQVYRIGDSGAKAVWDGRTS